MGKVTSSFLTWAFRYQGAPCHSDPKSGHVASWGGCGWPTRSPQTLNFQGADFEGCRIFALLFLALPRTCLSFPADFLQILLVTFFAWYLHIFQGSSLATVIQKMGRILTATVCWACDWGYRGWRCHDVPWLSLKGNTLSITFVSTC